MNIRNESELLMISRPNGTFGNAIAVACPKKLRQRKLHWIVLFLAAGFVAVMSTQAMGQKYDVLKLDPRIEQPAFLKKMTSVVKQYSQSRDVSKVKDAVYAQRYLQQYIPIKITQPNAVAEITPLLSFAQDRLKGAQRQGLPQANKMLGWLYNGLKPIAVGNYSPPARINAILFIAKMNERAAVRGQAVPVPVRFIPSLLLPIFQNEKNPDGVRAAALVGLHRYATILGPSMKPAELAALNTAMLALLKADPPEGRTEESHAYLQRFAVDILANIKGDAALGNTLVSISTETEKHDLIALHAAGQIATFSSQLKDIKPDSALSGWAVRAMRSFQFEIARLNAFDGPRPAASQPASPGAIVGDAGDRSKAVGGAGGDMGRFQDEMDMGRDMSMDMNMYEEDMGMNMSMEMEMDMGTSTRVPQPPEVSMSRRKLNYMLQQLHLGATGSGTVGVPQDPAGLLAAVAAADKPTVEAWLATMEGVVQALNNPAIGDRGIYIATLDAQAKVLEKLAGPAAVAAAADIGISLPGHSGPVAITAEPEIKDDVMDATGAPTFPAGLDEMAPKE